MSWLRDPVMWSTCYVAYVTPSYVSTASLTSIKSLISTKSLFAIESFFTTKSLIWNQTATKFISIYFVWSHEAIIYASVQWCQGLILICLQSELWRWLLKKMCVLTFEATDLLKAFKIYMNWQDVWTPGQSRIGFLVKKNVSFWLPATS